VNERPVIVAIDEDADGDDVRVTITLDWQDRRHYGTAVGRADPPHRARLAACRPSSTWAATASRPN
jgi:hypothetical protein